jgi:hypothetical protein
MNAGLWKKRTHVLRELDYRKSEEFSESNVEEEPRSQETYPPSATSGKHDRMLSEF